jgi:hypothetical protein
LLHRRIGGAKASDTRRQPIARLTVNGRAIRTQFHRGKSMKQLISAAVAAIFAVVTLTAAAQAPAPSGAPAADAPKAEKKAKKTKKPKKAKAKKGADAK